MKCKGAKNKRGRQNGGHSHFIDPTHGISQAPAVLTQQPVTRAHLHLSLTALTDTPLAQCTVQQMYNHYLINAIFH
jgi:hypothetical protein